MLVKLLSLQKGDDGLTRPMKKGVDYFPHACTHGQTMFILEQRWGNDGYAFWFKLLEMLGTTEGHVLDIRNPATRAFLAAKTRLTEDKCYEILDLLSDLDAIDQELWKCHQVIWCQNFVDHLEHVYAKRKTVTPTKPSFRDENYSSTGISVTESTQSKVNKIEVNKIKEKEKESKEKEKGLNTLSANASVGSCVREPPETKSTHPKRQMLSEAQLEKFNQFWYEYPKKKAKLAAMKAWSRLKPDDTLFDDIMMGLRRARASVEWKREGGRFIPHPATFLNQGRWEDEYLPSEQKPTKRDLQNMSVEEYVEAITGDPMNRIWDIIDEGGDKNETG